MIRLFITTATMLFLASAYFLYGAFVVPFTVALDIPEGELVPQTNNYQPPVLSDTAKKYFSDVAWLHEGEIKSYQSQDIFFYTHNVERDEESGNKILMSPIAMLWQDPEHPEKQPVRMIAQKGLIQFENQFFDSALQLTNSKPGRIVWGTLEGVVHIDGPDGLVLDGKQFVFSEQSGQLYSDYPVKFHYGPSPDDQTEVNGSADQLNLSLTSSNESILGNDMPRVGGVSLLTLRRNIKLNTSFIQKGERHTAELSCDGPFEYDFIAKKASFNSRVHVKHHQPNTQRIETDSLEAERLLLQFVSLKPEVENSETDSKKLFDNLEIQEIRAYGSTVGLGGRSSQVIVRSEEHDLVATMQNLTYNLQTRVAKFLDPKRVLAKRGETTFACPAISIKHSEDKKLEYLHCHGPGQLYASHEKFGTSHAEAIWGGEVHVVPDRTGPYHVAELVKDARIVVPEIIAEDSQEKFQLDLSADQLRLWVDLAKAEALKDEEEFLQHELPVSRAEAVGNVSLVSDEMVIEHSNLINVILTPTNKVARPEKDATEVIGASYSNVDQTKSPRKRLKAPIRLSIDQIDINVLHNSSTGKVELQRVDGTGDVTISHQPEANETTQEFGGGSPLILRGKRLVIESEGEDDQKVTLIGIVDEYGKVTSPAELEFGPTRIKGANITLDRLSNQISINGAGAFQIPVSKDFNGKKLDRPAMLEVVWQERMTFNGLDALFLEAVSCSLNGHQESTSRMLCDELRVRLTEKTLFDEKPDKNRDIEVDSIHAKYGVELESNAYEQNKLVGARRGYLAEFHVNQISGNFIGLGPGEIHAWTLGDQLKLSPTDTAEANQPVKTDETPRWRYSRLKFSGRFTGNVHQKTSEFQKQEIKILSAPVDRALVKFREDDVSLVENAVRLDCRSMKILQREFEDRGYWEIFAQNVNELEGQLFRAVADELSFDERLGRFILRGIGKDATLYFQERPGAPFSPSSHRYIEFIPKKKSITVDGSSGLSG